MHPFHTHSQWSLLYILQTRKHTYVRNGTGATSLYNYQHKTTVFFVTTATDFSIMGPDEYLLDYEFQNSFQTFDLRQPTQKKETSYV